MTTYVKICGVTNKQDAKRAATLGADFIGVIVEIQGSPRSVSDAQAKNIISSSAIPVVVLTEKPSDKVINMASKLKPHAVQLIGEYLGDDLQNIKEHAECAVWKTVRIPREVASQTFLTDTIRSIKKAHTAGIDVIICDTMITNKKGGTGEVCDWEAAAKLVASLSVPVFLAGGLNPVNVTAAVSQVKPYGIDVSSGVEQYPGKKDPQKIAQLIQKVKALADDGHEPKAKSQLE